MTPEKKNLIKHRLNRSNETLKEASLLFEEGHINACVNRIYYACFYCVSALLLTEGYSSSKHSGVRALFDRYWVNEGKVTVEMGRIYRSFYNQRQKSDYEDFAEFNEETVRNWIKEAENFVFSINQLIKEKIPD